MNADEKEKNDVADAINNLAQAVKVLANSISCDESLDHALGRASMKISDAINMVQI